MPGTIFTSLCVIIVQFLWALFSLVAALGSYACVETVEGSDGSMHPAIECVSSGVLGSQKTSGCYCMGEKVSEGACKVSGWGGPLMLLWMVSMFWGLFVMKNIVTCTVSGSVAAWWFTPEDVKPVKGALYRATCHSFGTLCKAALTVNIASFLLSIVEGMLQVVPGASCLFRFALTAVMYPLNYTVTFAGIYGLDFASAFRRVRAVFVRRGATSLANDLIAHLSTSLLLIITLFTFVVVLVLVVGGFLREYIFSFHLITSILFSYIAFVFVIATTVEVILSAVKAVLVCFIQDPEVLKSTRGRELHDELADAWVKIHPADTSRNDAAHPMEPLNTAHAQTQ